MTRQKKMVVLYINDKCDHFATEIFNRNKKIETRTKYATKTFLNSGVKVGDIIGIAYDGKLQGFARFMGIKEYQTEEDFYNDIILHLVTRSSRYAYDPKKGKCGILLADAERIDNPVKVERLHGYTWTELNIA